MIEKENLTEIGKFQKTHALRGELNAILEIDESYVSDGNPLIVDIDGIPVPFYAESVRPKGATSFLIKLKGIDNLEDASEMVNKVIYALREDLEGYVDEDMMLQRDLIGFDVVDEEYGRLGELVHIEDTTQNELMVVRTEDDEEIYIPLTDEFITGIEEENKVITTTVPQDLLELNKTDKNG